MFSVILACITIFGTSVTAFAADESTNLNENVEVVNLSQNIDATVTLYVSVSASVFQ